MRAFIFFAAFHGSTPNVCAQPPANWDEIDFWRKWPTSLSGATDPHVQGYWAPANPNVLPGAELNTLYGVHASVLYDGEHERLLLFRNRGLVYDLETPNQYWELDLVGSGDPVPTPNLHEPLIKFGVAHGDAGNIALSVYDVTGRRVLDLASEVVGAGHFRASWNARNSEGEFASPGVYFMRMTTAGRTVVTKFLVMR